MRSVQATFEMYVKLNKKVQPEVLMSVQAIDEPGRVSPTPSSPICRPSSSPIARRCSRPKMRRLASSGSTS